MNHLLRPDRPWTVLGAAPDPEPEPWPEGPWLLLAIAAVSAPVAVLGQGGDGHTALLASLVCLASPGFAIETMQGVARLALAMGADRR
ncbi:MAG: hypothetical protein JWP04_1049 [Belnapia sp.]|nr:hypothetical protein [Belnapia sp.]